MPHLFFSASEDDLSARSQPPEHPFETKQNMWGKTWHKVGCWLKKEGDESPVRRDPRSLDEKLHEQTFPHKQSAKAVVPYAPRPAFARQNSEQRERLCPVQPGPDERRAHSVDRKSAASFLRGRSTPPPPVPRPVSSSPKLRIPDGVDTGTTEPGSGRDQQSRTNAQPKERENVPEDEDIHLEPFPGLSHHDMLQDSEHLSDALDGLQLEAELEAKWILNLSMHFRDNSDREKFFITYAEEPTKWRRVTVSCDYRNMPADSLEADLKSLHYQRDKSARIYESIRDSLSDIQFYPTVTNLKLQTSDGRLHVHVTEDMNEIIPYPSVSLVRHLECPRFKESSIEFDSHLSGFVYKVRSGGRTYIKKEIPGPEAVEEFLYEVNALHTLQGSPNVVHFEGLVVDDAQQLVKGLLISFCDQGALVDLIYDYKQSDWLPWSKRERWAKQIVSGLAAIHEAGFVQGDFTLSNIVVDQEDNARIIDINRRGCPVGWEPPELSKLIQSGQRISIYIGTKSDLFQLGMVLWALAEEQDEPERQEQPLQFSNRVEIPLYYREIVESCLSIDPTGRMSAKDLLAKFPATVKMDLKLDQHLSADLTAHWSEKGYINPAITVGLEDIGHLKEMDHVAPRSESSSSGATFTDAATSIEYLFIRTRSDASEYRGRSPTRARLREELTDLDAVLGASPIEEHDEQDATEPMSASNAVSFDNQFDIAANSIPTQTPTTRQGSAETLTAMHDRDVILQPLTFSGLALSASQDVELADIVPSIATASNQDIGATAADIGEESATPEPLASSDPIIPANEKDDTAMPIPPVTHAPAMDPNETVLTAKEETSTLGPLVSTDSVYHTSEGHSPAKVNPSAPLAEYSEDAKSVKEWTAAALPLVFCDSVEPINGKGTPTITVSEPSSAPTQAPEENINSNLDENTKEPTPAAEGSICSDSIAPTNHVDALVLTADETPVFTSQEDDASDTIIPQGLILGQACEETATSVKDESTVQPSSPHMGSPTSTESITVSEVNDNVDPDLHQASALKQDSGDLIKDAPKEETTPVSENHTPKLDIQRKDFPVFGPPLHQDSGFDETLIATLEAPTLADPFTLSNGEGSASNFESTFTNTGSDCAASTISDVLLPQVSHETTHASPLKDHEIIPESVNDPVAANLMEDPQTIIGKAETGDC